MTYPDAHTHYPSFHPWTVYNLLPPFRIPSDHKGLFSAGIHPWFISKGEDENFSRLNALCINSQIQAIGEAGLDRMKGPGMDLQIAVFEKHITLAIEFNLPIIIHCVKAYSEVISSLKKFKIRVPVIFHGFRSKWDIAKPLIDQGYYLSFGKYVLDAPPSLKETIENTPLSQILIETDVAQNDISKIYSTIAELRAMKNEELLKEITNNFKIVFCKICI